MKLLSELPDDTLLCVRRSSDDIALMDKQDFLASDISLDDYCYFLKVSIAVPEYASFDLHAALEYIGDDDMYEGWVENMYDALKDAPETQAFLELLKREFSAYPTYYEGEIVKVDIF